APRGGVEMFEGFRAGLLARILAPAFVPLQEFLGAADDRARQARELGGVDAVALLGDAGRDAVEEDEVASLLRDLDVEVAQARERLGQLGQLVVVRGEEGLGAQTRVVVYVFEDGAGDGEAVVCGSAAPKLV